MNIYTLESHLRTFLLLIVFDISPQSHPNDNKVKVCGYYYFSIYVFYIE